MSHRRVISGLFLLLATGLAGGWFVLNDDTSANIAPMQAVQVLTPADPPSIAGLQPEELGVAAPPILFESGYSGTWEVRNSDSPDRQSRPPKPPRWAQPATEHDLPSVAAGLAREADYSGALRRMWQLCGEIEYRDDLIDSTITRYHDATITRFHRDAKAMSQLMFDAFAQSQGVTRQTLIFQIAIALPPSISFPWLRDLAESADAHDATDALCALAFSGDEAAIGTFELSPPSSENCRRIVDRAVEHDALARAGERGFLRSYRCIEALDRAPYFFQHAFAFGRGSDSGVPFPWRHRTGVEERPNRTQLAQRLLPAWMRHFEGHPGSDDMCYRLARLARKRGAMLEAAEWASIGATSPDEDMKEHCTALLLSLAEFYLQPADLDRLLSGRAWDRNRNLIHYIRLRRTAIHDFAGALAMAEDVAAREPDIVIAQAFRARWSREVPRGLQSGMEKLAPDDPLLQRHGPETTHQGLINPAATYGSGMFSRNDDRPRQEQRLYPQADAVQLSTSTLARQFRLWETQAELLRRRDATHGDAQADLEYKLAAVFYYDSYVLLPDYSQTMRNSGLPDPRAGEENYRSWTDEHRQLWATFRRESASWMRAADLFEELADKHRWWPARDKALFSAAMARIKLVDYKPFNGFRDEDIRAGVELFERVAREHPHSTLADDADNAASYWRRIFKSAFEAAISLEK